MYRQAYRFLVKKTETFKREIKVMGEEHFFIKLLINELHEAAKLLQEKSVMDDSDVDKIKKLIELSDEIYVMIVSKKMHNSPVAEYLQKKHDIGREMLIEMMSGVHLNY